MQDREEILKIGEQTLVIAGMATMPSRLASFELALNSILPQVDRLFLFLDRFDTPYISADPKVVVLSSQIFGDLRANGKLMGLNMAGPDAYYFCVDDDIVYPPDYVQRSVQFLNQYDNKVVCGIHASRIKPGFERYLTDRAILHRSHSLGKASRVDVAGTCTAAFHTGILEFDVRQWSTTNMVDLNFALECKQRNIPILAMPRNERWIKCISENQADSIFSALKKDDRVQTQLAKKLMADNQKIREQT